MIILWIRKIRLKEPIRQPKAVSKPLFKTVLSPSIPQSRQRRKGVRQAARRACWKHHPDLGSGVISEKMVFFLWFCLIIPPQHLTGPTGEQCGGHLPPLWLPSLFVLPKALISSFPPFPTAGLCCPGDRVMKRLQRLICVPTKRLT